MEVEDVVENIATDEWARAACLALPGAAVDYPFGPENEVFRVGRKMFALLGHFPRVAPGWVINLKADPEELPLLVSSYSFVYQGFHMNKRHWISVALDDADLALAASLIDDSYDTVRAALPRHLRPPRA